jgi:hypothetical protein
MKKMGRGLFTAGVVVVALVACAHEPRTVTAVVPFAYTDDAAVYTALVGKGAKPGPGEHPALTELPTVSYFDPTGYPTVGLAGHGTWDDSTAKGLAAGVSASVTSACAGSLGISASSAKSDNADVEVTRTLGLDPIQRRYTTQLKACCEHYDEWSCKNWVVNRAFKTKVSWSVKSDGDIGANGQINCGNAAPPPVSVDGGVPTAALNVSDGGLLAAATQTGVSAMVSVDSSDHHTGKMTSEGWNVVETVPLRQVCAEWRSVKAQSCTGASEQVRKQLLCD